MDRTLRRFGALGVAAALLAGCGTASGDDGVAIEFFQFKPEAVQAFNDLIVDFEAENPGIDVTQNPVPEADTAIRTRLVRNDIPDVMTLNGNFTFGDLSKARIFRDFSDDPVLQEVNPAIVEILTDLGAGGEGEVNGIPFANNASGIIYNADLFAEHGVEPPTTYDELVAAAQTFQDAGVLPFYATLGDAWTSLPAWNSLSANYRPEDFFDQLRAGEATWTETYPPVIERLGELFSYAQPDKASPDYNQGNSAFAAGESAMYLQGSFAIPSIRTFNPEFEIGTFAMPAEDADDTLLVSGIDVVLTMGRDNEHPEESMAFIEYLMRPEVVSRYAAEQSAYPALEGLESEDPALDGLLPYFDEGRITGYSDHQVPPSIPLDAINQEFLIDGDEAAYLAGLDDIWERVRRRQPTSS